MQMQTERTTVTLPRGLARRLRTEAEASGRSLSALVREAVEAYLNTLGSGPLPSFTGVAGSGREDISERSEELIRASARRRARGR